MDQGVIDLKGGRLALLIDLDDGSEGYVESFCRSYGADQCVVIFNADGSELAQHKTSLPYLALRENGESKEKQLNDLLLSKDVKLILIRLTNEATIRNFQGIIQLQKSKHCNIVVHLCDKGLVPSCFALCQYAADEVFVETQGLKQLLTELGIDERKIKLTSFGINLIVQPKKEDTSCKQNSVDARVPTVRQDGLKILFCNRPEVFEHPGGDTVMMQRICDGLSKIGHQAVVDLRAEYNPKDFDIAHIINCTTQEVTYLHARRCFEAGVPYVVSCLYEDWPQFFNQMNYYYLALEAYIKNGQQPNQWGELSAGGANITPRAVVDSAWALSNAAVLLATGDKEKVAIARDFQGCAPIKIVHLGCEVANYSDNGELFFEETGLRDFVFCVGRLETRKNQLMLLKALEHSELPLVFAAGNFSYQPQYEELCRRFQRKGSTIFLPHLRPEVLASAYAAARVHVLPSWYELPGLVSLEAAAHGCNIVATDWGTARDYLGGMAFYCNPDDDQSIYQAIMEAWNSPNSEGLSQQIKRFSWKNTVTETAKIYQEVLRGESRREEPYMQGLIENEQLGSLARSVEEINLNSLQTQDAIVKIPELVGKLPKEVGSVDLAVQYCIEGDNQARASNLEAAREYYLQALEAQPDFPRALRSLGVIEYLAQNLSNAEKYFREALNFEPRDSRSLVGLGSVAWQRGERSEAFEIYLRAAETEPNELSVILHLVDAAYKLERLADLENALRRFVKNCPDNLSIQYCLAGCYYRMGKNSLALGILERILRIQPTHVEANELKGIIEKGEGESILEGVEEEKITTADLERKIRADFRDDSVFEEHLIQAASPSEKLRLLEEAKRRKEFSRVVSGVDRVVTDPKASSSDIALARILKAEALAGLGDTIAADLEFINAEIEPSFAYRALIGRGAIAAAAGQHSEAKRLFEHCLQLKPAYDIAYAGLGLCAMAENSVEDAWSFYEKALRSNPECLQALHGIVHLSFVLDRQKDAEGFIENFLEMNPVNLPMVYSLAGCYFAQGKHNAAREQCRKILLFEPAHELAQELLGKIDAGIMQSAA